ncbi:hypothetical protein OIU77_004783 [Salix suchowensis]|uniref:Uncharacterized protein n=1 Tax=Salix suchowensis TaxID=1278906 RepID=A0ABQ9AVK8_9ROSI|nr:hypothetical protein OIU77_004783 [Salix suchowensis]KAJ6383533.1 hypothetical protein OIU78_026926 [Salix suchowensis]
MTQREENNVLKVSRLGISFPGVFLDQGSSSHVNMVLDHLIVKGTSRVLVIDLKLNSLELPKLTNLHLEFFWWPPGIVSNTECFDFSVVCPNLANLFPSHFDAWRIGILKISGPNLSTSL